MRKELLRGSLVGAERLRGEIDHILAYMSAPVPVKPGAGFAVAELPSVVGLIASVLVLREPAVALEETVRRRRLQLTSQTAEVMLREILEDRRKFHPCQGPDYRAQRCTDRG